MEKSKYSNCGSTKTKSGGINFFGTPKINVLIVELQCNKYYILYNIEYFLKFIGL